jgi:hypothetical protein
MKAKNDDLFDEGDPFDDPRWKDAEMNARKIKKTWSAEHIGCPLEWLKRVVPRIKNKNQLIVMLVLYRRTILDRSKTVSLPNGELDELGVSRYAKYRALGSLKRVRLIKTVCENGKAVMATLLK